MITLGNTKLFFQSKFSFGKTLPKYFWEVGVSPDNTSNTEYISLRYLSLPHTDTYEHLTKAAEIHLYRAKAARSHYRSFGICAVYGPCI